MLINQELQKSILSAIQWEPLMNHEAINVIANDGIVTLSGTVNSYAKKINAKNATKKVVGVKSIAENIRVELKGSTRKKDTEIAEEILHVWNFNCEVPQDQLQMTVEDGWVKIEGEVSRKFQQEAAKDAIKNLSGVTGVTDLVRLNVKSNSNDVLEKLQVENALARNWAINSQNIKVEVLNNRLKLKGLVQSLYQKEEAGRLAWNAPGVILVENELAVIQ
jgi:osmotically-inducible protein OsmY